MAAKLGVDFGSEDGYKGLDLETSLFDNSVCHTLYFLLSILLGIPNCPDQVVMQMPAVAKSSARPSSSLLEVYEEFQPKS